MSNRKSIKHVVDRIARMGKLDEEQEYVVRHMIEALVRNRDVLIDKLTVRAQDRENAVTPKMFAGALKDCIKAHGPITREWTGSAAKRLHRTLLAPEDNRPPYERTMEHYVEAGLSPAEGLTEHGDEPPIAIWGYWRDPRWKAVHEYRNGGYHESARYLAQEIRDDWDVK